MISAGDFRKGVTFEMDGQPFLIIDFQAFLNIYIFSSFLKKIIVLNYDFF